ncbi:MAG: FAD:protein FMN transferase [Gammaproteobacteria bacterium]
MKHKVLSSSLLAAIVLLLIASCERNGAVYEDQLNVLGTFAQISIAGLLPEEAKQAAAAVEKDLQTLDHIGFTFETGGELQQLNEALAEGRNATVSDALLELIKEARKLSAASDGVFNPATGELTAFWEFHCSENECGEAPYPDEVQRLVDEQVAKILSRQPSMDDLIIKGNEVGSRNRLVKLEFGDIIRGLALEKGIQHLADMGVSNAMIDIGGNVRTIGTRGDHDWWIGIPDASGQNLIGSIENIDDHAVITVRAFDKSFGKRDLVYRHIVDPRSGLPVKDVLSVTVMHDNAMIANASAVAFLIAGIKDWKLIADKIDVHKILVITKDGTIYTSPAMEHIIHWKQGIEHQHLVP